MKSLHSPFKLVPEIVANSTLALAPFRIVKRDIEHAVIKINESSITPNVNAGSDAALAHAIQLAETMQASRAGDVLANLVHTHTQLGQIIANMQAMAAE